MSASSPTARANILAPSSKVSAEQLAQVAAILKQLDHHALLGRDAQRRRAPRVSLRLPLSATLLQAHAQPSVRIFSRNLSTAGIGFVSKRLFLRGDRFALALVIPGQPPKLLLACVTFSRYVREGIYEAGAEFLDAVEENSAGRPLPDAWLTGHK